MKKYEKIRTIYKRDMEHKSKRLLEGCFSFPEFEYLANNEWIFTEKVDGTNIRIMWQDGKVRFGGRTDAASIPSPLLGRLAERFPSPEIFGEVFEDCDAGVCLYGEGYGAKIQKGDKYRPDQDFVLFDIWVGGWWLRRECVESVAEKMGLDIVPVVGHGTLFDCADMVRHGLQSQWGRFEAEGIVARPAVELCLRNGGRVITKIKGRDFRE